LTRGAKRQRALFWEAGLVEGRAKAQPVARSDVARSERLDFARHTRLHERDSTSHSLGFDSCEGGEALSSVHS